MNTPFSFVHDWCPATEIDLDDPIFDVAENINKVLSEVQPIEGFAVDAVIELMTTKNWGLCWSNRTVFDPT